MNETLRAFLRAWIEWVDTGAPEHPVFHRSIGLCNNLLFFAQEANDLDYDQADDEVSLLCRLFEKEGLCIQYPFGGFNRYVHESECETAHLNEERLSWVRAQVAQLETV